AGGTERLWTLDRPDGGADRRELRLPHCTSVGDAGHLGSGDHGRRRTMTDPATKGTRTSFLRDRWFTTSVGIMAAIAVVAAIAGFAWLPLAQRGEQFRGMWDAICSAAGLVRVTPAAEPVIQPDHMTTRVEVIPQMLNGASAESIGRGAT